MNCPYCGGSDLKVLESRESDELTIRRRRECQGCQKRFTTYERIETVPLTVIKKDSKRVPFDRQKILSGMLKACEKRPISRDQIEKALTEIEMDLRTMNTTEIPSKKIGSLVMKKLKKLDKVAYIRFASVYKEFADVENFEEELKILLKKKN